MINAIALGGNGVRVSLTETPVLVSLAQGQVFVVASTVDFYFGLTANAANTGEFSSFAGLNVPVNIPVDTSDFYIRAATGTGDASVMDAI